MSRRMRFQLIALITIAATAPAQSDPERPNPTRRPSFEYEQCFNDSQIKYDRQLTACARSSDRDDSQAHKACLKDAREAFEARLRRCPIDTGRR